MGETNTTELCQKRLFDFVGNKIDLDTEREVFAEEGKKYAELKGMEFFETSAKENRMDEAFYLLIDGAIKNSIIQPEPEFKITENKSLIERQWW